MSLSLLMVRLIWMKYIAVYVRKYSNGMGRVYVRNTAPVIPQHSQL